MSSEELETSGGTEEFIQSITTELEQHSLDFESGNFNIEPKGPLLFSSPHHPYLQQQKQQKHHKPDVSLIMNQEPPAYMDNTFSDLGSSILFESESNKNRLAGTNVPTPQKYLSKLDTIDNIDELNDSDFEADIDRIFKNLGQRIESLTDSESDNNDCLFSDKVNDTILKPKQFQKFESVTSKNERISTPFHQLKPVPHHYLPTTANTKTSKKFEKQSDALLKPKNFTTKSKNNNNNSGNNQFSPAKLAEQYLGVPANSVQKPNQTLKLSENINLPLKSTTGPELSVRAATQITSNIDNIHINDNNFISKNDIIPETLKSQSACELNNFGQKDETSPINDTLKPTIGNTADFYWSEKENRKLENKLFRQSTHHKTEIEQLTKKITQFNEKLETAKTENQTQSKYFKTEIVTLDKKIRDLQSEKVQLVNKMKERDEQKNTKQSNELQKITSIADHYKTKNEFLQKRLESHDEIINCKSQEIAKLEDLLAESNQKALELSNELKQQAKNFLQEQTRLENVIQESKMKSQKQFQRDKVLSIQKFQEDFAQTQKEEIQNLKQTLSEEKQKTITRLEENYSQKVQKLEENIKKLESECTTTNDMITNKNDIIKNMELKHNLKIKSLQAENQKLVNNSQRISKESAISKIQAVAKARQECEESYQNKLKEASKFQQKTYEIEMQKSRAQIKKMTDDLTHFKELNNNLLKKEKEMQNDRNEFEQNISKELSEEIHANTNVGMSIGQRLISPLQKRQAGSLGSLTEVGKNVTGTNFTRKDSVQSILKIVRSANEEMRKHVKEVEQKLESEKRKNRQLEQDHQIEIKQIKKEYIEKGTQEKLFNESREKAEQRQTKRQNRTEADITSLEVSFNNLKQYSRQLETEIKQMRKITPTDVMEDPRVVDALKLLAKLRKRLNTAQEDNILLFEESEKLRNIIERRGLDESNTSNNVTSEIFNEKLFEYSQLKNKYKQLIKEKLKLERSIDH